MRRSIFLATSLALSAAPRLARGATSDVSVAYAGSLVTLMERSLGPTFDAASGATFKGQAKGSTALANLISGGLLSPDVFVSADIASVRSLLDGAKPTARWYATWASTRVEIAYSPKSNFAADFDAAAKGKLAWYELLQRPGVRIARTDPAQDPKGYRVLLVMALAERYYKVPNLSQKILGDPENSEQVLPEESALARLDAGEIDGLWAYSTESVSRGLPAIALPPEIDLGDPARAATYATASVTVAGKMRTGSPSVYAFTIPTAAPNAAGALAFGKYLLSSAGRDLERKAGLTPLDPTFGGDVSAVPAGLRP